MNLCIIFHYFNITKSLDLFALALPPLILFAFFSCYFEELSLVLGVVVELALCLGLLLKSGGSVDDGLSS